MTIAPAEAEELKRLLLNFQSHLEASVISALLMVTPTDPAARTEAIMNGPVDDSEYVDQDRADWKAAKVWIERLGGAA